MVNPESLLKLKVIKKKKGWLPKIKILNSQTDLTVKIQISKCLVSDLVKEKILKAGGEVVFDKVENSSDKKIIK
jgi:ribosomal protein L15